MMAQACSVGRLGFRAALAPSKPSLRLCGPRTSRNLSYIISVRFRLPTEFLSTRYHKNTRYFVRSEQALPIVALTWTTVPMHNLLWALRRSRTPWTVSRPDTRSHSSALLTRAQTPRREIQVRQSSNSQVMIEAKSEGEVEKTARTRRADGRRNARPAALNGGVDAFPTDRCIFN
jgi:hypothetical protein